MSLPTTQDTEKIHAQYRAFTGMDIAYTMECRFYWEAFLVAGLTESDLACVVRYIKGRMKKGRREIESLAMRNLVRNLQNFREDLATARAESRNTVTETPRQSVLRATGRTAETPEKTAQASGMVLEQTKLAAMLREWRESNPL